MTTFAPVSAPAALNTATDQQHQRTPVDFGRAVTHRDLVRDKMRVDPASLAHKKRHAQGARNSDPPREPEDHRGQHVDIEV